MDYNVYKVQNSINHMLNPSEDRDVNNIYQLSTEKQEIGGICKDLNLERI